MTKQYPCGCSASGGLVPLPDYCPMHEKCPTCGNERKERASKSVSPPTPRLVDAQVQLDELNALAVEIASRYGGYTGNAKGVLLALRDTPSAFAPPTPRLMEQLEAFLKSRIETAVSDQRGAYQDVLEQLGVLVRAGDAPSEEPKDYKTLYFELLMEVAQKYPGESRHDTARRYIREREIAATRGEPKSSGVRAGDAVPPPGAL